MSISQERGGTLRSFDQAVAIVTGGASGIGRALGAALARRGATVILADRQGDEAAAVAERIRAAGGRAEAQEVDVRDAPAVDALVGGAIERHGRIDYLFNNAGIVRYGEARDLQLDDWRQTLDVNLMGVIHGIHAAYPHMLRQGFGHIVNTASMAGLSSSPQNAPYGASKAAIVSISRSLRIEAAAYGVRVSVLCPGFVRTPIFEDGGRYGRDLQGPIREIMRRQNERMAPMDPDRFAERALAAVRRNRAIVILPGFWRILDWLDRFSPSLVDALAVLGMRQLRARIAKMEDGPKGPAGPT